MKRLLHILIFLAVAMQSMIPLGFMPGAAQAGTTIVICSGMDQKTIHLDQNGQPAEEDHNKQPCPYSLITGHVTPVVPALPMATLPQRTIIRIIPDSIASIFSFNKPLSRGPPLRLV